MGDCEGRVHCSGSQGCRSRCKCIQDKCRVCREIHSCGCRICGEPIYDNDMCHLSGKTHTHKGCQQKWDSSPEPNKPNRSGPRKSQSKKGSYGVATGLLAGVTAVGGSWRLLLVLL